MTSPDRAQEERVRVAYADPPYPGQSDKHYADHPDYGGEVDHWELCRQLVEGEWDGWALSTSAPALHYVMSLLGELGMVPTRLPNCTSGDYRIMAWVKPFAAFKRNVKVAYAWEPVLVKPARNPEPNRIPGLVMRDWIAEPITMKRGLSGAKPERFCWWLFEVLGIEPDDEFHDLFPGSGAVTDALKTWKQQLNQMRLVA